METIKVMIITKPMETGIIANQDKVEKTQQIIAVLKNISKSENNNSNSNNYHDNCFKKNSVTTSAFTR